MKIQGFWRFLCILWGKCDCVEAQRCEPGCRIPAADFPVCLYPVEYKHGSVREEPEYNIQLCAQAMCLEEMYHTHIPSGAIFFITAHRRLEVAFTSELRAKTKTAANALWEIRRTLKVPAAEYGRKCQRCSLKDLCMPRRRRIPSDRPQNFHQSYPAGAWWNS